VAFQTWISSLLRGIPSGVVRFALRDGDPAVIRGAHASLRH